VSIIKTLLSFVIPCYRSEETIEKVINEIIETVSERERYDYEIICVNDCSPDNVQEVLKKLAKENEKIKVVRLAKNKGKHAAVLAGYTFVKGEYIVNLDDDCQCPTGELWKLLEPVESGGYDIATAKYKKKQQALWKNLGSDFNAKVGEILLGKPRGLRFENFCIIKRFVADEMSRYSNPFPFLEGLMLRITENVIMVPMEERQRGDNKGGGFTLKSSIVLFLNGFTAFSIKPLRISTVIGFVTAIIGFILGIIMIIRRLVDPTILSGYTSTFVLILLLGGLILMSLGLLGEYVGRIYISINHFPQFVIREQINVENREEKTPVQNDGIYKE
jgi:undecaprenyl-phosphate 4-deoxy-4-formamido-L-arabinose transferase